MRKPDAFTLPEMLLAIVTIAVLAAVAVTLWQSHTVSRHVRAAAGDVAPVLEAVAGAYVAAGEPPRSLAEAGLDPDPKAHGSRYLESVDVRDGVVSLHFGHRANPSIAGRVLRLAPALDDDGRAVTWRCLGESDPGPRGDAAIPPRAWPALCEASRRR